MEATVGRDAGDIDLPHLDGLTYAWVEFRSSSSARSRVVRALVDTGSTNCDLRPSIIADLSLPLAAEGGASHFETAAGRHVENCLYEATISVHGRVACVRISAADEEEGEEDEEEQGVDREFGFAADTDDAILGCEALAQLGLLVDCQHRRLAPSTRQLSSRSTVLGGETLAFAPSGPHVPLSLSAPGRIDRRIEVRALVDTGCTDIDLDPRGIGQLGLRVDPSEILAEFETAGGVTIKAPIYRANAHVLGRSASVRVSPSEVGCSVRAADATSALSLAPPGGADTGLNHDEALLGHDALAALGLLVDCAGRQLVLLNDKSEG